MTANAPFPRHLRLGNTGRDVGIVKRALALEVPKHRMTGTPIIGSGTMSAIAAYQAAHNIREDGYGLRTHRELEHRFTRADRVVLADLAAKYPAFPARHRRRVFATQYGGPRDPGTPGHVGAFGDDLSGHPDSYAELSTNHTNGTGNDYRAIAVALGERYPLPRLTPIRVTYKGRVAILYKRDIGFGGNGPGGTRGGGDDPAIDLWWMAADRLGHLGWDYVDIEVGRH